jgi:hypothetical protein
MFELIFSVFQNKSTFNKFLITFVVLEKEIGLSAVFYDSHVTKTAGRWPETNGNQRRIEKIKQEDVLCS